MARYKDIERDQGYFLTVYPGEHFGEDSLERLIDRYVDENVDIRPFSEKINNDALGQKAIHPYVKLKAILYSFSNGIKSSHKMENLMQKNHLGYIFLTGNRTLDHSTICNFIKDYSEEIESIFSKLLMVMNEMGMIDWSKIITDGTKVSSNAFKGLTSNASGFEVKIKRYRELSKKLMDRIRIINELESKEVISTEELEKEKNDIERQRKVYDSVIRKIEEYEKEVKEGKLAPEEKINLTDRESKLLKEDDGFTQGYNVQASFSNNDVIVCIDAANRSDKEMVEELVRKVETKKSELGVEVESKHIHDKGYYNPKKIKNLIDDGYDVNVAIPDSIKDSWIFSDNHFVELEDDKVFFVCKNGRKRKGYLDKKEDRYEFRVTRKHCDDCNQFTKCWKGVKEKSNRRKFTVVRTYVQDKAFWENYIHKMQSPYGQYIYNKRIGKEHNFHTLKTNEAMGRLFRRGKQKCNIEVYLTAIAHNLRKMHKFILSNKQLLFET